jgi:hypothetical protein
MIIEEKPEKNSGTEWWAERTKKLLEEQNASWPLSKINYENLSNILIRSLTFDDFEIRIQHNPDRINSTSAILGDEVAKLQKCVLCSYNLPVEQRGIVYNKHFFIFPNPYPIFPEHFTISKRSHTSQTIIGNFSELLDLSRALGKYYTILYNGPRCGSSLPDHMHFQAVTKNIFPVEYEFDKLIGKLPRGVVGNGKIEVHFFEDFLRYFISFKSRDKGELLFAFKVFVNAFKKISEPHNEPMMNITASYNEDTWRLILFPRQMYIPHQLFADIEGQLLVSPAAVDMSGLIITPCLEDYEKIKEDDVIDIFKRVTIAKEYFEFLRKKIGEIFL